MASRSFVIFQDTPLNDAQPKASKKPTTPAASTTSSTNTTLFLDKENVNPLTGQRAGPQEGKKRKTNVLTTKSTMPLGVKHQAEVSESKPEKKRKASGKKAVRASTSSKKATRRSPRRAPPMPKVEEEVEVDVERSRISQAEIDSRCYELTVQPLADVSKAYDEREALLSSSPHNKHRFVKGSSLEPEIRDYVTSIPESKLFSRATTPIEHPQETIFSTPERKRIYSAFTFSSPSPTSERFRKMNRATSVPPLQFGDKPSYTFPASSP